MSGCHQAHNIPWHVVCNHLVLSDPIPGRHFPASTSLIPSEKPSQQKDLEHFARKLSTTIQEFSLTERAKYPRIVELDADQKMFPDDLLGLPLGYTSTIGPAQQSIVWWRSRLETITGFLDSRFGDMADLVKRLYNNDLVHSLLFLAQQPDLPIEKLRWITYSNFFHYGTNRVYEDALAVYICLNVLIAFGYYGDGFRDLQVFANMRRYATNSQDYDVQSDVHRQFFVDNERLQEVGRIKGYLKRIFRLLYLSDMVVKECGEVVYWENIIKDCLSSFFIFKFDQDTN